VAYTREDWIRRVGARMDFPGRLTHLTRRKNVGNNELSALDVLIKILREKRLEGSSTESGFIVGRRRAVCFQEVPLYSIAQNLTHEATLFNQQAAAGIHGKIRYDQYGLIFAKDYVFVRGGRPVVYDKTADAKDFLREDQWWRIVRFDLSDPGNFVDWTHEREWRVPDDFTFDLNEAFVLVPNRDGYQQFLAHPGQVEIGLLHQIAGIVVLSPVFY
jgi:hypothetical protein